MQKRTECLEISSKMEDEFKTQYLRFLGHLVRVSKAQVQVKSKFDFLFGDSGDQLDDAELDLQDLTTEQLFDNFKSTILSNLKEEGCKLEVLDLATADFVNLLDKIDEGFEEQKELIHDSLKNKQREYDDKNLDDLNK